MRACPASDTLSDVIPSKRSRRGSTRTAVTTGRYLVGTALFASLVVLAAPSTGSALGGRGALPVDGALTCDFAIPSSLIADHDHPIAGMLERDRMYMSARPGFFNKHTLMRLDESGNLLIGGRYLFTGRDQAQDYRSWVESEFVLDGTRFWDRPYFLGPECHVWNLIGAYEFGDVDTTHVVARTERWSVAANNQRALLADRWPAIRDQAADRGLTAVWLLYAKQEQLVSLVYFADRIVPNDPLVPDFASLGALESAQPLGRAFDDQGWTRKVDRTQWDLTIWSPFVLGDHGQPSAWPNSPPFPEPFAGDGVCEPSRDENARTAPTDCRPACGDAVAQPGEDSNNCPGDVRLFKE
jgi:hypothetical protein